jgi:glycosyltransferase involved in cell wall biosynthesis
LNSQNTKKMKVVILCTHPVQYYSAWYKALAKEDWIDLEVWFGHKADSKDQAKAGFGVGFEWDIPILEGYKYRFLKNISRKPGVSDFWGTNCPEIGKLLGDKSIDALLVHGWASRCYVQAIFAANRRKIPVLVRGDSQLGTHRNIFWKCLKEIFYRFLMTRFSGFLAVGKRSKDYYLYYGAKPEKIFISPHFVDNDFFNEQYKRLIPDKALIREQLGVPNDALVFSFVGKLIHRKNPMHFLQAFKLLNDYFVLNKNASKLVFHGLVIGDGPLKRDLEHWAKINNIPVSFLGFLNQSEISNAYIATDVLVLPSDPTETWGLVVNESFNFGIYAIVSDSVGCHPDLVIDGITGYTFRTGVISEFANRLIDYCSGKIYKGEMNSVMKQILNKHSCSQSVMGLKKALEGFRIC